MSLDPKDILFRKEARQKVLAGMDKLADAVGSTLGPLGRNVAVDEFKGVDVPPTILHDGKKVADSVDLKDKFEDMGARILKGAALKTNEKAGDGTTTSTVLAQALVRDVTRLIDSGINPMVLKAEIEAAAKVSLEELKKMAKPVKTAEETEQVASISAASSEIGKLVAEAITKVGENGNLTVEEGSKLETEVEYKQGMEVDRGYLSSYFVTDQQTVEAVIENPYILLTDRKLNYSSQVLPFLERFVKETGSKNLVIFAGEMVEEALATLVVNKMRGSINVVAIQAPAYGARRVDELEDIAIYTGGKPLLEDEGRVVENIDMAELGRADKIIVDRDKAVIIGGKGQPAAVERRQTELREQLKIANTGFDQQIKGQRLANLSSSVAVITVGAATEVELREKKERVIDAVHATKAAMAEGIVAGGEVALLNVARSAPQGMFQTTGGRVFQEALKAPFKKLLENSGIEYAEAVVRLGEKEYPFGIDVTDGQPKDLIKSGIIDPVKVTRSALENAVSVSVMAVTIDTLITWADEDKGA